MADFEHSLAELRRLGLHLDPVEAQAAAERRRVRLNTRAYPVTRAAGFQALILVLVAHNALVLDDPGWGAVVAFAAFSELYVVGSWLVVRRWFLEVPRILSWDVSDLFFLADLLLWGAAIRVSGGPLSLLWLLPLLRVADHHTVGKAWVFAHLAPVVYGLAAAWPPRPPGASLEEDLVKMGALWLAGLYIAWTGLPARWYRDQREAALSAGSALLARLTDRTERLDEARRSRSALLEELGTGIRTSLVEIVGFSRFLLRSESRRTEAEHHYLERIHAESRSVLRSLDRLPDRTTAPVWPRVSLTGLLQAAATEEASQGGEWREAAALDLPFGDVEIRTDGGRLRALVRHLLAAGRQFQGGPPRLELVMDPGTRFPEAVVMTCPAREPAAAVDGDELFNPFSGTAVGDQDEMAARLELGLARTLAQSLGYEVDVRGGPEGTEVRLRVR